jgi:hypothetical protein
MSLESAHRASQRLRAAAPLLAELGALLVVALVFGRAYLDLDPSMMPMGREYPSAIQPYHFWSRLLECGACALWNGSVRGGLPALLEVHAGLLHPLPAVAVLLFGVQAGMKLVLVASLWMAGVAQWWLARVLGAGRVARLWTGAMAIVAGNLAARMEGGWVNLVLSGAACALVLAPLVGLLRHGGRRWVVVTGLMLGLAMLAGQGYLQIGLLTLLPAAPFFAAPGRRLAAAREIAFAVGLALLFAAPLWMALLPFLGAFGKAEDLLFTTSQSLRYLPLNWVVDDNAYYRSGQLGTVPFLALYSNYVGWAAVLLAALGLLRAESRIRLAWLLALLGLGALWLASATPMRWGIALSPLAELDRILASVRNPVLIAGLSVPPLLGLAALGLDHLMRPPARVPSYGLSRDGSALFTLRFDPRWLLAPLLVWALLEVAMVNQEWLQSERVPTQVFAEIEALETANLEWVMPPFGEHIFIEMGVRRGLKLVSDLKPWYWRDHPDPEPHRVLSRNVGSSDVPGVDTKLGEVGSVGLFAGPDAERYATLLTPEGALVVCQAGGVGGHIDITCPAPAAPGGVLTVREHHTSSWRARVGDVPTRPRRAAGSWIEIDLPARNTPPVVNLRYRPLAPYPGLVLAILGWVVAGWTLYIGRLPHRRTPS